jgi:inosine-uridine nucleoside N-ribohydrolase
MGGSVRTGYLPAGALAPTPPGSEYNIAMDPDAAAKVFASGVPLYVMPLDSTQLKLDETKRAVIFTSSTALTDALTLLYQLWSVGTGQQTPTLFDVVTVAYVLNPNICPVIPMHLQVDSDGRTRETQGNPNSFVCLRSDDHAFFDLVLGRLTNDTQAQQ